MIFLFCVIYTNAGPPASNSTNYSSANSMTQQTPSPAEQAASQAAANTQAQLQQARGVQNAFATQSSADSFAPYGVTMQMSDQTNAVVTHALVGVAHQALGLGMDLADLMMAPINKAMASFGAGSVVQSLQASEAQIRASLVNTTPAQQLGAEAFNVATLAFGEADLVLSGLRGVGLFGSLGGGIQIILDEAENIEKIIIPDNRVAHIFRDAPGHVSDTALNRQILQTVAEDPSTTLGTDKFGNTWSAQSNSDGSQTWVQTRNGQIINGGINLTPHVFDQETGLSNPLPPRY